MNPNAGAFIPKAAQQQQQSTTLRASARVFVPGGGSNKPPPLIPQPQSAQQGGPGPAGYAVQDVPPPPPPGPPPAHSSPMGSPMGSPTGSAPPSYNQVHTPVGHGDPFPAPEPQGESSRLSGNAKPWTPGSSKPAESSFPVAPAAEQEKPEEQEKPAAETKVLTIDPELPPKEPLEPFKDSKLPVPEQPNDVPETGLQLNGSWSLHVDEHAIQIGAMGAATMQQAFHDPVPMATINCMEKFWRLWHNVPQPSTRTPSFTYYWFRKDVKPNWEDPRNKNGGTINITLDKADMDDSFMAAVLLATGESVADSSCINGVSLKIRNRFTMMQIWTNVSTKPELQNIAEGLRTELEPYCSKDNLAKGKLDFFSHQSTVKNVLTAAPKPKKGKPAAKPVREPDFQF